MTNNEVLRSIQHVLGLNTANIIDIFKVSGQEIDQNIVEKFLQDENESSYTVCNDNYMTIFLNGLITYRRGKSEHPASPANEIFAPLTNNIIFKKLKIAFDLKENDLIELMSLANYDINKNELSAISRKPGHKHYRLCSDDFLMGFLVGLTFRQWN